MGEVLARLNQGERIYDQEFVYNSVDLINLISRNLAQGYCIPFYIKAVCGWSMSKIIGKSEISEPWTNDIRVD